MCLVSYGGDTGSYIGGNRNLHIVKIAISFNKPIWCVIAFTIEAREKHHMTRMNNVSICR